MATGPNSTRRKADARKKGKCQLCGAKTQPAKAKSVVVDPPGNGEVKIVKAREGKSFWCSDCAKKKASSYERAIERKNESGSKKKTAKKTAPKKAAAKSGGRKRPAAKKAAAKKTTPRKRGSTKRSSGRKTADPF